MADSLPDDVAGLVERLSHLEEHLLGEADKHGRTPQAPANAGRELLCRAFAERTRQAASLITTQAQRIEELTAERDELQQTFDLRWKADQRAIAVWQALNPGNDLTWPDRADLVVWLLEKLDAIEAAEVTGWPWPSEDTLAELARLTGRDREGAAQLAIDLGKTFGVPPGFAAHHYVADKGAERAQAAEARILSLEAEVKRKDEALSEAEAIVGELEDMRAVQITPVQCMKLIGARRAIRAGLQPQEGKR